MYPFKKQNPFHANILNLIIHDGLISLLLQIKICFMYKARIRLYPCLNKPICKKQIRYMH